MERKKVEKVRKIETKSGKCWTSTDGSKRPFGMD
jgi:hypothetical protein